MCGRYALTTPADVIAQLFRMGVYSEYALRYNIAPTQMAPVVRTDADGGQRKLEMLRWGLIPFWAKDESIGNRMINARSETAGAKPAFRKLLERRRCVIPADAFYEWKNPVASKGRKQPFALRLIDDRAFGFAGLWDRWKGPADAPLVQPLETFTILTTSPNAVAKRIHDRMPVILSEPEQWDAWLDDSIADTSALQPLFQPMADALLRAYPVSSRVSAPANDDPTLLQQVANAPKPQATDDAPGLFG